MNTGKTKVSINFIIGICLVLLLPTLIAGYGYEYIFHVKYSIISTLFYWFLVFCILYFSVNIFFVFLKSTWGKVHLVRGLVKKLKLRGNEKILDVGCGVGVFSIEAAFHLTSGSVVGVDLSNELVLGEGILEARENAKEHGVSDVATFVMADGTSIPLEEESFDLVASIATLHNLATAEKRNAVLREVARLTKPGGHVLLVDVQFADQYASFFRHLGWPNVKLSKRRWSMFPPVQIVTAVKPKSQILSSLRYKESEEEGDG